MTAALGVVLVLLIVAYGLRIGGRHFGGPSARPNEVVHIDGGHRGENLISHRYRLVGQPDYILEDKGERFPMERKSRALTARGPYDGERLQLAAYCLLLEEQTGQPVRRGRLEYRNRAIDIPFDSALRAALLGTLRALEQHRHLTDVRRSHSNAARCRGCGFRHQCSDSLES